MSPQRLPIMPPPPLQAWPPVPTHPPSSHGVAASGPPGRCHCLAQRAIRHCGLGRRGGRGSRRWGRWATLQRNKLQPGALQGRGAVCCTLLIHGFSSWPSTSPIFAGSHVESQNQETCQHSAASSALFLAVQAEPRRCKWRHCRHAAPH